MSSTSVVQKLKAFVTEVSVDIWAQFREWEQLCCPKQATIGMVVLFLFFLFLELAVFVMTLLNIPKRIETGSYLLDNGVPSILLFATTGSVVQLAYILTQRNSMGRISSTLLLFDRTLQRLDFRMRCQEIVYWTVGWGLIFAVATASFSIAVRVFGSAMYDSVNLTILIVFINVTNIPYSIFTIWFMICELSVWCRMKLLYSLFYEETRPAISSGSKWVMKHSRLIAGVTDLHYKLATVVGHINAVFAVQVTICLVAFTILLIFCLFSYYRAAVVMGEIETNFAWLIVSWSIYNSCFQLPKIFFGAWLRQETDRLKKVVHQSLRYTNVRSLQDQLFVLSQQLEHHPLDIRNQLFTISWPVYASIIGYISTYVVILIQFDSKAMDISKGTPPVASSE